MFEEYIKELELNGSRDKNTDDPRDETFSFELFISAKKWKGRLSFWEFADCKGREDYACY
jgi:hypothetical protein